MLKYRLEWHNSHGGSYKIFSHNLCLTSYIFLYQGWYGILENFHGDAQSPIQPLQPYISAWFGI